MNDKKLVLLDGAVGTGLWAKTDNKVAVWRYNLEDPRIVQELHQEYLDAGAQIILANTFGANRMALRGTDYTVEEIVSAGVRLAREALAGRAKTALSIGPLPVLLEPYGDLSEEEAYAILGFGPDKERRPADLCRRGGKAGSHLPADLHGSADAADRGAGRRAPRHPRLCHDDVHGGG